VISGPWKLISGVRGRWFLGCPHEMVVAIAGVTVVVITLIDWVLRYFVFV
jgi:hypothetical protein